MREQVEGLSPQSIVQHEFCSKVASGTLLPVRVLAPEFLKGCGLAGSGCTKEHFRTLLTDSYNCFRRMTREGSAPLTTLALIFIGD